VRGSRCGVRDATGRVKLENVVVAWGSMAMPLLLNSPVV
jgi:hypothetical protein